MIPHIEIDKRAIEGQIEVFRRIPRAAARTVAHVAVVLAQALKDEAPVAKPQMIHPMSKSKRRHYNASIKGTARVLRDANLSDGLSAHAEVGTTAPHSRYVQEGTRAHIIEARRAKVLAIYVGGSTVFGRENIKRAKAGRRGITVKRVGAKKRGGSDSYTGQTQAATISQWSYPKRVHHPGTRANPFATRAKLRLTNDVYAAALANAIRKEVG